VREGTLKKNWGISKITNDGGTWKVEVYNNTKYAPYVEFGHRATTGKYIGSIGRRLTTRWVSGRFMLTNAVDKVDKQKEKYIEKEVKKLFGV
jgi:hypothetical protein